MLQRLMRVRMSAANLIGPESSKRKAECPCSFSFFVEKTSTILSLFYRVDMMGANHFKMKTRLCALYAYSIGILFSFSHFIEL